MKPKSQERIVILFPHTSKWDAILYLWLCLSEQYQVCAIIDSPWLRKCFIGWLLSFFPGLFGTYDKRKGGTGGLIKDGVLAKQILTMFPDGFCLWVSPVGNIHGGEWR